ncbi:MAG: 4Fe-4S binding protein [Anaerolineae bacterium]
MGLVHGAGGEVSRLRRWSLYTFARYLEMPLLAGAYHLLRGRGRRLGRSRAVRALVAALGAPFAYAGDTSRALPTPQVLDLIETLPGQIAVGPCRCRAAHGGCDHPLETDLVIQAGVDAWTRAFPHQYRMIDKAEAQRIVTVCSDLGMWHMVFVHCPLAEHGPGGHDHGRGPASHGWDPGHEYVICNCCTCGCVPYILNRELGQRLYPLLAGEYVAHTEPGRCTGDGACLAACPFSARALFDGRALLVDTCFGCGLCAAACPEGAISMPTRGR